MIIDPYTWRSVTIRSIDRVTDDTISVQLTKPDDYTYVSGQYAIIRTQQLIRQYSFISTPDQDNLELLIQLEPGGAVTGWFHNSAKLGDTIEVSQAFGNFTLPADTSIDILLIAGRVGVAPFISMLRGAKSHQIALLYSVRDDSQVCYPKTMTDAQATIFVTSSGEQIDKKAIKPFLKADQLVYVCGSKRFVDGISALLYALDIPLTNVKRELFTLQ